MAEDEIETGDEESDEMAEGVGFYTRKSRSRKKPPCCNPRIDELSTPARRIFLALWNEHAYHLPKDKVKNLKLLLQKLYAMSPEETAQYFAEIRAEAKAAATRRKLKQKLRKYLMQKHNEKQKRRAYKLFKRLLKCGISYAARNPVPPLVSIRLRYLADIILEQLCALRCVDLPNRTNPDRLGNFLISVADWMAIAVERLYFAAQMSINEMTLQDEIEEDTQLQMDENLSVPKKYEDFGPPAASSTPQRLSLDSHNKTSKIPSKYEDFGPPAASSTPQRLSVDSRNKTMKVPSKYDDMGPPVGASSPRRRSLDSTNQKQAEQSTKRISSQDLIPYYSIIEAKPVATPTPKKKKTPSNVPYYSIYQMEKTGRGPPPLNTTALEIPPYSFTYKRSRQSCKEKESIKEEPRNRGCSQRRRKNATMYYSILN